jgi:hypothetical protein
MVRKLFCSMFVMTVAIGFVCAEDFRASITQVKDGKVTFYKIEGKGKDAKKSEKSETLPVKDGATIAKGKFDKDTKKLVAGDAIEGGLTAKIFKEIDAEKGVGASITTDDGKITQILVGGGKKKTTN